VGDFVECRGFPPRRAPLRHRHERKQAKPKSGHQPWPMAARSQPPVEPNCIGIYAAESSRRAPKHLESSLKKLQVTVFLVVLTIAVAVQWASGAFTSDFDGDPDEPAHVVSSLLVRDYITQDLPHNPLTFARAYQAHFPKIAIGHWPPLFHTTEALWTLAAGRSKAALIAWLAVLAAGVTTLIFVWTRRGQDAIVACFAAVAFFASPLVQVAISSVMPDILLALLAFAAASSLGAYWQCGEKRYAVWFAVFAFASAATNGRGIAVALICVPTGALLSPAHKRRWLIALFAAGAFLLLPNLFPGAAPFSAIGFMLSLWQLLERTAIMLSWPVAGLAVVGAVSVFRSLREHPRWAPMLSLAPAAWMFQSLGGWPLQDRYLLMSAPAVAVLAAAGCQACLHSFRSPRRVVAVFLCAAVVVAFDARHYSKKPDLGYHIFASEALAQAHTTSLIAGDAFHEGSYIAEMDLLDPRRAHTILRATKMLSLSTWAGNFYRMRFASPSELGAWLDNTDVTLVIVETTGPPHVVQLLEALRADAAHWRQLPGAAFPRDVRLFERRLE